MYIRNYRIIFKLIILSILLVLCSSLNIEAQNATYHFDLNGAQGQWEHVQLDGRDVICTDTKNKTASLNIDIPEAGCYQLMVSLYHEWRKYCPFLYFKVTDSKGSSFSDYTFSEQRFYLEPGKGRWEYRCPSASPFWYLAKGEAKVKFWVEAKNDCWEGKDVPMEGKIFVEKLVLILVDIKAMTQPSIKDRNNAQFKQEF